MHVENTVSAATPLLRPLGLRQDLNLLLVLRVLLETGNVSETARRLDSTQPSISRMLERLRGALGDPLLIKSAHKMVGTQRANELKPLLTQLVALLQDIYRVPQDYSLGSIERTCIVGMNDSLQAAVVPALLDRFRLSAPHSKLKIVPLAHHHPKRALLDGEIDLLVGMSATDDAVLRSQEVLKSNYICITAAEHPLQSSSVSIADFADRPYLDASNTGIFSAITDRMFSDAGLKKNSVASISSFLAVPELVAGTTIVSILPSHLLTIISRNPLVRCFALNTESPPHSVSMYWHNSKHFDPFFADVRNMVADIGAVAST